MEREKQIKSSDWLIKGYSKEELAEMKAKAIEEAEICELTTVLYEANHKKSVLDYHWLATEAYNAGYRKVDTGVTIHMNGESELTKAFNEAFAFAPQLGWISVEDRLPQENEKVLAINSDNEIFIATYLVHKISPSARGYTTWASGLWNGIPTHWMPLPTPPKMKGADNE